MQVFINRPIQAITMTKWPAPISLAMLAEEPSLFSCSMEGVQALGGPLAKTALAHVMDTYANEFKEGLLGGLSPIIDVRVQRLMPGMYPAIPGWHCDGVPRCSYHGQPDFKLIDPSAFHVACTLSSEVAGISHTEFVEDSVKLKLWDDQQVYKELHTLVERVKPRTRRLKDGEFAFFTPKTIHRATATHRRGWRMFFRFSMYHKPPIANGVTSQQQVYLLSEENGW